MQACILMVLTYLRRKIPFRRVAATIRHKVIWKINYTNTFKMTGNDDVSLKGSIYYLKLI
jgi:hypothetical protein